MNSVGVGIVGIGWVATQHLRAFLNNPRVRVAPCDMRGNVRGDWVEARAAIVDEAVDEAEARRGHQLLDAKYGWMKKLGNFFGKLRGNRHAVITIRFD